LRWNDVKSSGWLASSTNLSTPVSTVVALPLTDARSAPPKLPPPWSTS
jgi:hypothetical protein